MKTTNYILPLAAFAAGALLAKRSTGAGIGANKYIYHKVIQQNWGYGWDDVDFYECDSTGYIKDKETRELFKTNLRAYRTEPGQPYPRVITRKELNKDVSIGKLDKKILAYNNANPYLVFYSTPNMGEAHFTTGLAANEFAKTKGVPYFLFWNGAKWVEQPTHA